MTSFFSLYEICSQFIGLKLSIFFQSLLRILDFVTRTFEKKCDKKINCGRWFENVDVILPDSVSSSRLNVKKILSIKIDALEILVGKNKRGNKKLKLRVSIKLFIESDIDKSKLKSPRIIFLQFQ